VGLVNWLPLSSSLSLLRIMRLTISICSGAPSAGGKAGAGVYPRMGVEGVDGGMDGSWAWTL
jgi:hypothetical protein